MIKHIVCFKLKENEDIKKAQNILLSMKGNVPQIISMEANIDILHSNRSYDIILEVSLKDMQSLNDYQKDAYHCNIVKKHMHAVTEKSISVDYQF